DLDYGRIFVLAGSPGMTGAAALVCNGALRSGAGLITLGIPKSLNSIMEVKLTEVMTQPLPETREGTVALKAFNEIMPLLKNQDVLAIGPGLSQHPETKRLIRKLILHCPIPLVLDADALNALVEYTEMLAKIKSFVIITPHPKEFSRLFRVPISKVQQKRKDFALHYALKYNITIVLKGHKTIVAHKKRSFVNTTGNPGLATGGSGDILTGIIASFIGQGIDPFRASQYAVCVHGYAADLAVKDKTPISLIPSDLLDYLPRVFKTCGL
ncbi:MAG: NAD(P)H-hydrate dehydratase, partial [Candidatus Omnitrophica bacterium]|nr:NAD(P)H-hydrate dehydratase [Candidatus Omnitrophota bacterium]